MGRIFGAGLIAIIISATLFGVITAVIPQSLTILEPVFCKDWQTMEIETISTGEPGEFTIDAACTGDGEVPIGIELYLAACGMYFLPTFTLLYILSVFNGKSKNNIIMHDINYTKGIEALNLSSGSGGQFPGININVTHADSKKIADTFALIKEALNDGVITPDELERIQAKVQGSETVTQSLSERLNQLQDAYSQGLITQDEYVAKRRAILDNA